MKHIKCKIIILVLLFAATGLVGCGSIDYPKAHHKKIKKDLHTLSYTADIRGTHIIQNGDKYWILTEPPPDAAFSYDKDDVLDLDLSIISVGGKDGGQGKEGAMSGSEDLPLTGRASYVVLARELCYRVNEMAFNTDATAEQYIGALSKAFDIIQGVAAIEAANIQHSAQVHINTGVTSSLSLTESQLDTDKESLSDTRSEATPGTTTTSGTTTKTPTTTTGTTTKTPTTTTTTTNSGVPTY
tara:strand:+ start:3687 stop:4412 length:726 start_codon:yes stop_codon:yes gene_type:complete